jgi:uncharacterized membrane protein
VKRTYHRGVPDSQSRRHRHANRLGPRRAVTRLALAAVVGLVAAAALSTGFSPAVCAVAGWDLTAIVLLSFSWLTIWRADATATQHRCASDDPGRNLVYGVALLTSALSFFAAFVLSRQAKNCPLGEREALIAICGTAVLSSWALTHTLLTLRYAHLYYREDDEGVGGLVFPGGLAPDYFDFAYFAFTIGMCFQVSDVTMTSPQFRRTALGHALLSFAYNTVVVAFTLNLVFGAMG